MMITMVTMMRYPLILFFLFSVSVPVVTSSGTTTTSIAKLLEPQTTFSVYPSEDSEYLFRVQTADSSVEVRVLDVTGQVISEGLYEEVQVEVPVGGSLTLINNHWIKSALVVVYERRAEESSLFSYVNPLAALVIVGTLVMYLLVCLVLLYELRSLIHYSYNRTHGTSKPPVVYIPLLCSEKGSVNDEVKGISSLNFQPQEV